MTNTAKNKLRNIKLLGIPACLGAPLAGCARGPAVIRALLKSEPSPINFEDLGDLTTLKKCKSKKCITEIAQIHKTAIEKIKKLSPFKKTKTSPNPLPVLIGGDHSMNFSLIREAANQTKKSHKSELGLIWFDAHGDFNIPETTITGNIHGMILSALAGRGIFKKLTDSKSGNKPIIKEENICIFGVRDLDPKEEELLKSTKINVITAKYIKKVGVKRALEQATSKLPKYLHLSFDLDVFDPRTAPGTNTPSIKGFSNKHLDQILEFFQKPKTKTKPTVITSLDIMEFNPNRDKNNKTAELAVNILKNLCQIV